MTQLLENISLDCHFAEFVAGLAAKDGEGIYLAALLASMATRRGDSCLLLEEWAGRQLQIAGGRIFEVPELKRWREMLRSSFVVGISSGSAPLVLEDGRLYLSRYWQYEESVAGFLRRRGESSDLAYDRELLAEGFPILFPKQEDQVGPDWQLLAGLAVFLRSLAVISGGPGTGKTTTVALILALLGEYSRRRGERMRVALAAPTGKAAVRLQETIARLKGMSRLPSGWGDFIPDRVMTIHRLLGVVGEGPFFRYNEDNPLPYDLLVVDEASMVDLPLMAKLFGALGARSRLVLLGDRHQLASVEPGSVLGDICAPPGLAAFSETFAEEAGELGEEVGSRPDRPGPGRFCDSLVELRRSRRFEAGRGIAILARAIRDGDFAAAWECLQNPAYPEVKWRELAGPREFDQWLAELVSSGCFAWLRGRSPEEVLAENGRHRVLCALRQGVSGADQVNRRLREFLAPGSAAGAASALPVTVLRNDYELELFNGDTGVIWPGKDGNGDRAYFPGPGGTLRGFSPSRLPEFQAAYAMTVHKSQGSEFSRIDLVLPGYSSPVLSRELLFTAVTRAREEVTICGTAEVLAAAIGAVTERRSGLRWKLWGG